MENVSGHTSMFFLCQTLAAISPASQPLTLPPTHTLLPSQMNLASRCREALAHVTMLKRELAAHQRRSAEALAMQRQNYSESSSRALVVVPPSVAASSPVPKAETPVSRRSTTQAESATPKTLALPKLASPPSEDSSPVASPKLTPRRAVDVAKELELLDETVAKSGVDVAAESLPNVSGPVDSDDFEEEESLPTAEHAPKSLDDVPGHRPTPENKVVVSSPPREATTSSLLSPKAYFPHSASPKLDNYNEEYPADLPMRKRGPMRPKLTALAGFNENEDEGLSPPVGKKSSLDAFEASFATDFPDTFSPRDSVAEEKKSETYNPFQSPTKSKPGPIRVDSDPRKDPPGKSRTSHRSMHNKVFSALSHSPRREGLLDDPPRSPRPVPPSRVSPQTTSALRKNGFSRPLNPPPLDNKPVETTSRARHDRSNPEPPPRKVVPFDEGRSGEATPIDAPGSPPPEELKEQTPPVSVKDRASMFGGGGPRSPERESMRLNSLNNRFSVERSFVDEGDIPMVSSIGRSKTTPTRLDPGLATPTYVVSPRSPSYSSGSFGRGRVLPWEDKEEMENRRGRPYHSESKLRRAGDFYSFPKEEKNERE